MIAQSGLGKGRDPWTIRAELAQHGLSMASVGRSVDVSRSLVQQTCRGVANNRRTLAHLLKLGITPETLFPLLYQDPEAHRDEAALLFADLRELGVQDDVLRIPNKSAAQRKVA